MPFTETSQPKREQLDRETIVELSNHCYCVMPVTTMPREQNVFYIEPEVPRRLDDFNYIDISIHPPMVEKLTILLDGWLGDEVLEIFPCFFVTEKIKRLIESVGLSGVTFDSAAISTSSQFEEIHPSVKLPDFFWLKVTGTAGVDDFGIASDYRLVVSQKTL